MTRPCEGANVSAGEELFSMRAIAGHPLQSCGERRVMNIELPDIFQIRNVIAVALALAVEWGLSSLLEVPFRMESFALILIVFIIIAWLVEKLLVWLFKRKRKTDLSQTPPE
ncbi:MAG: hypothetical protein MRY63_13735 [Neomegalonema sp.]|nr:hypothetical protein [Neomegalonema sp.]